MSSSSSAFLAVDLDAVLDNFESQEEAEALVDKGNKNKKKLETQKETQQQRPQQQEQQQLETQTEQERQASEERETFSNSEIETVPDLDEGDQEEISISVPKLELNVEEADERDPLGTKESDQEHVKNTTNEMKSENMEINKDFEIQQVPGGDDKDHVTPELDVKELDDFQENLEETTQTGECSHVSSTLQISLNTESEGMSTSTSSSSPPFESFYDTPDKNSNNNDESLATEVDTGTRPKEISLPFIPNLVSADEAITSSSTTTLPESPPPYSEIDPMSEEQLGEHLRQLKQAEEESGDSQNNTESENNFEANVDATREEGEEEASTEVSSWISSLLSDLTEDQLLIGKVSPEWVLDMEALNCMICNLKFTLVKRRHHCRTCGKVLCSACCSDKAQIPFMDNKWARVCKSCLVVMDKLKAAETEQGITSDNQESDIATAGASASSAEQVVSPARAGVLKRNPLASTSSNSNETSENRATTNEHLASGKQVMFSDGIKPGGDLADLDGSSECSSSRSSSSRRRRQKKGLKSTSEVGRSLIPSEEEEMPDIVGMDQGLRGAEECGRIVMDSTEPVGFRINKNLKVYVKLVKYEAISQELWNYRSEGLSSVGQDEVIFLLVRGENECSLHKDIFEHFQSLYEQARAGHPAIELSYYSILSGKPFLNSLDYGGVLYLRLTYQSVENLDLPSAPPFLFAVLITKFEMPWARLFPLRLMLRLGAEMRFYPAPIWSERGRKTVYWEIGNTIMKLLCDFKNYSYSLPIISGLSIQMELKLTTITVPKDRYRQVQRALVNSNEPVLALASTFSRKADSHLVAVQANRDDEDYNDSVSHGNSDYETQAINMMNKNREITGASFVIFNGALKSASGLTAKSSIVEDGIMVQVTSDRMVELRKSLEKMEDFSIQCGPIGVEEPDEVVKLIWVDKNDSLNPGVKSHIDGSELAGVSSIRLHLGRDYVSDKFNLFIRWCEVFLVKNSINDPIDSDPPDPMAVATMLAKASCSALTGHLRRLKEAGIQKLAIRVALDPDNGGYEAGSQGQSLDGEVMNSLDTSLVPIILGEIASNRITLEMVFQILEL